mmetsp:Transcript_25943/g.78932  ORF Transcript_25943/g.78932 Transcript_25943/m.78932 type:complete len:251 (-) Transcript_25943:245-997(-)
MAADACILIPLCLGALVLPQQLGQLAPTRPTPQCFADADREQQAAYGAPSAPAPSALPPPQLPPPTQQQQPRVPSHPMPAPTFPVAPHLTLSKYETMQGRRVRAIVAYTKGFSNLIPEVVTGLKTRFPDLKVQQLVEESDVAVPSFSIRIDGVLCASSTTPGRLYMPYGRIMLTVERARRRRRPKGDVYDASPIKTDDESNKRRQEAMVRLELEDRWHPAVRDEAEREAEEDGDGKDEEGTPQHSLGKIK